MDDLIDFLRDRLDEREAKARAATPGPWRHNPDKHWRKPGTCWFEEAVFTGPPGADAICVAGTGETDNQQAMANAAHIADNDPATVLADIAAKRQIIAMEPPEHYDDPRYNGFVEAHHDMLRSLGVPYAGHPDYRDRWRP